MRVCFQAVKILDVVVLTHASFFTDEVMSVPANETKLKLLQHKAIRKTEILLLRPKSKPNQEAFTLPVGVNLLFLTFAQLQTHAVSIHRYLKQLLEFSVMIIDCQYVELRVKLPCAA